MLDLKEISYQPQTGEKKIKEGIKKYSTKVQEGIEDLFLELGAKVLSNVSNLIAASPDESVKSIKKDLKTTINKNAGYLYQSA